MKLFIPSYDRAGRLPAVEYFQGAGLPLAVVVPVSQRAAYEAALPGVEILTVPDAQDGNVNRKRNAVMELIRAEPDQTGWMVDDDVQRFVRCLSLAQAEERLSGKPAEEWRAVLHLPVAEIVTAMNELVSKAKAQGAVYFGFSNTRNFAHFDPTVPFSRDRFIAWAHGFIYQPGMKFDERFVRGGVLDFYLQMAGKSLRDNRYAASTTPPSPGGITASMRTRRQDYNALQQKWGSDIVKIRPGGYGVAWVHPDKLKPH